MKPSTDPRSMWSILVKSPEKTPSPPKPRTQRRTSADGWTVPDSGAKTEERPLTTEELIPDDVMHQHVEEADGPNMVDVRHRPETDAEKSAKLVEALEYALRLASPKESANLYAPGWELPGYLEKSLLQFHESMLAAMQLALPNDTIRRVVQEAVEAGAVLNRVPTRKEWAFEVAGQKLGMPAFMVEKAYYSTGTPSELEPYPKKRRTPK